jgi:hypothetical protein
MVDEGVQGLLYYGCTSVRNPFMALRKFIVVSLCSEISAYALCSDSRNIFVVYWILAYE